MGVQRNNYTLSLQTAKTDGSGNFQVSSKRPYNVFPARGYDGQPDVGLYPYNYHFCFLFGDIRDLNQLHMAVPLYGISNCTSSSPNDEVKYWLVEWIE